MTQKLTKEENRKLTGDLFKLFINYYFFYN